MHIYVLSIGYSVCRNSNRIQQVIPKLHYTDLSSSSFSSQTSKDSIGPVRPNLINRWTKFQAKEHPEQYDMDDGIVIADEKKQRKNKLRSDDKSEVYQDSILVQMNEKETTQPKTENLNAAYPRVRVDLYMESLCPDTHYFVRTTLNKIVHDKELMDILDLHMYMFGKGRQVSSSPAKFECQHGPSECYGNMVEGCLIKHNSAAVAVEMMICLNEKRKFGEEEVNQCASSIPDRDEIMKQMFSCMKGEGEILLQKAYDKTPHDLGYVPSVRINKESVNAAGPSLRAAICKKWVGPKISTCP